MAFKILSGPYLNHLARTATTPTMDPVALTGFPITNLYDNRASLPCIFSTGQDGSSITVDLNLVRGGDFESTDSDTYWTVMNTGTPTLEGNTTYGAQNYRLTPVSVGAVSIQDITVRSGEVMTFTAATQTDASTNISSVLIRNRQTGNFLSSSGAWTASTGGYASGVQFVTSATSGWSFNSVDFAVESLDVCKADTVTMRIYLYQVGGGFGEFDAINLWPHTNWCSVHGHNISPFIVPTLQYSSSTSTWDDAGTMTARRDSFYLTLGSTSIVTSRYVRFLLDGYPDVGSLPYIGELVLGYSFDLIQNPSYGGSITWTEKQVRLQSAIGDQWVHLHGGRPVRSLSMSFNLSSTSEYDQLWKQVFRGSRGGSNLVCVAPVEMDVEQVILGRVREALVVEKLTPLARTTELEVVEAALPNVDDVVHVYDEPIEEA